ncbi:MAG: FemAB family PEP-CTERM system-associated protein [Pseudomonadota bacterium]|nr:FemAB family PEP-CTERM system-associated protein [Pseudomonadota bacterium]
MNSQNAPGVLHGPLSVRPFAASDRAAWTSFVQTCADATFFHRIEWRDIIERVFAHRTHYLVAERGGQIAGVLPLAQVKSLLFGHSLVSLPFAVYGGAAVADESVRGSLHEAAAELAQELGADHLELRDRISCEPSWPQQDLFVTFRKPISADDDANMQAIPRKQRAMVRKGIQRGLMSQIDPGVDRFFALYADNAHRHGTPPFPKRYFEALQREFGDACEVMTVVTADGRPVSSVLSFYFRDEVLPYYAGDIADARDLAANDFKYWELMRRSSARGCRIFDYGRSKQGAGSFDFKKNWGFTPQPLHYEFKLFKGGGIPQNNPANPKYRAVISLWRRLPRPLVNALGPSIVRNLG